MNVPGNAFGTVVVLAFLAAGLVAVVIGGPAPRVPAAVAAQPKTSVEMTSTSPASISARSGGWRPVSGP